MTGQWIGHISGKTNSGEDLENGRVIFNIDYDLPNIAAVHIRFPYESVWGEARLLVKGDEVEGEIFRLDSYPNDSKEQPILPAGNTFRGRINDDRIEGTWVAGITHSSGSFVLVRK